LEGEGNIMSTLKMLGSGSNWKLVAYILIQPWISKTDRRFSRPELMRNVDKILPLLKAFGHKKMPQHPEETLQRTIQNMRDNGLIDFLGQGEYKLTEKGYNELISIKEDLSNIKSISNEELQIFEGIMDKINASK
jgi:hypothetical protein